MHRLLITIPRSPSAAAVMLLLILPSSAIFAESGAESVTPAVAPGTTAPGVAPGTAGAPAAPAPAGGLMSQIWMLPLLIIGFMYLVLIRPQRKEEKKRKELIAALKRGDKVVTIGGLRAEVAAIGEQTIDLKVGQDSHEVIMTFSKSAVSAQAADAKPAAGRTP